MVEDMSSGGQVAASSSGSAHSSDDEFVDETTVAANRNAFARELAAADRRPRSPVFNQGRFIKKEGLTTPPKSISLSSTYATSPSDLKTPLLANADLSADHLTFIQTQRKNYRRFHQWAAENPSDMLSMAEQICKQTKDKPSSSSSGAEREQRKP